MTNWVTRLWKGEMGLGRSFWEFGVLYGTLIHLVSTGLAFAMIAADLPAWLAVVIFFLPAPYTVLIVVAVWRSADRYQGPAERVPLARIAVVIWALLVTAL
jgi:hypothetical protein